MKPKVSKLVQDLPPSGIRVFFDLVLGMKDVVSLGVGEPDFVTPWNIREAAIYALERGYTSYTSNKGMIELRQAISRYLERRYGMRYDPEEEILITVGTSEAFDLALRTVVGHDDEMIVPIPSYVSYGPIIQLCGGRPVYLETNKEGDFKVAPKDLKKLITRKTKGFLLNYPNNPTGASYTKAELKGLAEVVKKNDLVMISDEIYCELTYDYDHVPFPTLPGMKERTIYINGFSKSHAMTGWRIGYACGPKDIIDAMNKIHQYTMLCASIIAQMAAMEALKNGDRSVQEMKREYRRRREFVVSRLNDIGLHCHKPEGAFYAFPSIRDTGLSSMEFAQKLLRDEKVAVVPGTAFSSIAEGHIRISYASGFDKLREAFIRMERFIKKVT